MLYSNELRLITEHMRIASKKWAAILPEHIHQKAEFDLVTDADQKIEQYLADVIAAAFPEDRIIGEEWSSDAVITGRTWTIDPIDGTCNFAQGAPLYAIQCALIDHGELVLGAIYLPQLDEMYTAVINQGCFRNGQPISCRKDITPNNAMVSFGDYTHSSVKLARYQHNMILKLYPQIAKIRMFGSAAIDFAFVASGRTNGTVVITKNLWDLLPGIILCREAGAHVTNLDGQSYHFGDTGVIASGNDAVKTLLLDSSERKLVFSPENRAFHACLFDFDGVIMDTEKYHLKAWNRSCEWLGISITPEEYLLLKSTGRSHIIDFIEKKVGRSLSAAEREKISRCKGEYFQTEIQNLSSNDMLPGVKGFLDFLLGKGIPAAVVSSSKIVKPLLKQYALAD